MALTSSTKRNYKEIHEKITRDSINTIQTTTGLVTNTAENWKPRQEWRPLGERLYAYIRRQDWTVRYQALRSTGQQ